MLNVVVFGAVMVIPIVAMGGVRRWPWRYVTLGTLGWVVVLVAVRLTIEGIDPGLLVWVGALGGSVVTIGFERGERERVRRSESILMGGGGPRRPA